MFEKICGLIVLFIHKTTKKKNTNLVNAYHLLRLSTKITTKQKKKQIEMFNLEITFLKMLYNVLQTW